jgi:hypothetical protein
VNTAIGNLRSIVAPKRFDPAKIRRQNVSALSSFLSIGIVLVSCLLGQCSIFLCQFFGLTLWSAAVLFFVLALLALALYILILRRSEETAFSNVETLTGELSKA